MEPESDYACVWDELLHDPGLHPLSYCCQMCCERKLSSVVVASCYVHAGLQGAGKHYARICGDRTANLPFGREVSDIDVTVLNLLALSDSGSKQLQFHRSTRRAKLYRLLGRFHCGSSCLHL